MQRFGVGDGCSWRRKFQLHPLSFIVQSSAGDGVVDEPALHRCGASGRHDLDMDVDIVAEGAEERAVGVVRDAKFTVTPKGGGEGARRPAITFFRVKMK